LTREDETDTLSRNVGNNYHTTPRNIPEERRAHQHRSGSLNSSLAVTRVIIFDTFEQAGSISVVMILDVYWGFTTSWWYMISDIAEREI
jgi:hypothetical protein